MWEKWRTQEVVVVVLTSLVRVSCAHQGNPEACALRSELIVCRWYYRVYCADCSADDVVDKLKDLFDKVFH